MLDLHPYTILVSIFVVLALKQIVNHVGKSNIQEFAWLIYLRIGTRFGLNKSFVAIAGKKNELASINREKRAISAQDEYAKWTKLNRSADKLLAEIKVTEEVIAQDKNKVNKLVSVLLMIGTTLPVWFARYQFRKVVLIYLPRGVFPHYVEWFLALPFITVGGVGLTVWMFTVNQVLSSVSLLVSFPFEPVLKKPTLVQKISEEDLNEIKLE